MSSSCSLLALSLLCLSPSPARAGTVVLANRSREQVSVRLMAHRQRRKIVIPPGRQSVLSVQGPSQLLHQGTRFQLVADSAYFFAHNPTGQLEFHCINLGGDHNPSQRPPHDESKAPQKRGADQDRVAELPIKILVDNHDPTPRRVWEKRLRGRIDKVSQILEQHCRLRLKVVAVETWDADDQLVGFKRALSDFRKRVDPAPACLAIGFTGRQQGKGGRVDLGATQGMLQSHILIREWDDAMSAPERTEVLLHEIGHYLGAIHSSDAHSVMRPILADDKAIHSSFHIEFDPVNTLIINLVANEFRSQKYNSVSTLTPSTRHRLTQIYRALLQGTPHDKSIRQYLSQLNMAGGSPLTHATRLVVREVRRTAQRQRLVAKPVAAHSATDQLTELYVRRAAAVASRLPRDLAPAAFILGLGIALDDADTLLSNPITADFSRDVETGAERQERRETLGQPTLRGRRDLARHFFLSAYLTAVVGAPAAESAGWAKEMADARSQSGFSYRDLAADLAGIHFAERLLTGKLALTDVASHFTTSNLMPEVADLPEGVPWSKLKPQLKSQDKTGVTHYRTMIRDRVHRLSHPAEPHQRPAP